MSMYTPQIKEEVSENAKMLVVEEDGKVYRTEMPFNIVYSVLNADYTRDLIVNGEVVFKGTQMGTPNYYGLSYDEVIRIYNAIVSAPPIVFQKSHDGIQSALFDVHLSENTEAASIWIYTITTNGDVSMEFRLSTSSPN